jgi:hypothetical protein
MRIGQEIRKHRDPETRQCGRHQRLPIVGNEPTLRGDADDLVSMQKAPVPRSLHQRFMVNKFIGRPRRAAGRDISGTCYELSANWRDASLRGSNPVSSPIELRRRSLRSPNRQIDRYRQHGPEASDGGSRVRPRRARDVSRRTTAVLHSAIGRARRLRARWPHALHRSRRQPVRHARGMSHPPLSDQYPALFAPVTGRRVRSRGGPVCGCYLRHRWASFNATASGTGTPA